MNEFLQTHRIVRKDDLNLVLQYLRTPDPNHPLTKEGAKPKWIDIAYCGNSPSSLAYAIRQAYVATTGPDLDQPLQLQLETLINVMEAGLSGLIRRLEELIDL